NSQAADESFDQCRWSDFGRDLALSGGLAHMAAERDGAEIRPCVEEAHVGIDHQVEKLSRVHRSCFLQPALDGCPKLVDAADGDGVYDGLFVREEAVQPADGDVRFGGYAA